MKMPKAGLSAALILLAGVAVYGNSLRGAFVFDDLQTIVANPDIRQLCPAQRTSEAVTTLSRRPVVRFSLALNYLIGGLDVRGYHVVNTAVHVLCALVLFGIIRRTLGSEVLRPRFGAAAEPLALVCALVWLAHPLQTEVVDYVTQRTESIAGFFYL